MPRSIVCALLLVFASSAAAQAPAAESPRDGASSAPADERPDTSAAAASEGAETPAPTSGSAAAPASGSQDASPAPAANGPATEGAEATTPATEGAETTATANDEAVAPKIAVIVVGDPDPALRAAARRVERAVGGALRVPFDPGLRAALRGEPGEPDDGLGEVRSQRRRLSADEAHDAPILASLGHRAGAVAVAVVRAGVSAPELLVLDVRNAAFYEGTLRLESDTSDARVAELVARRARTSSSAPERAVAVPSPPAVAAAAVAADPAPEEEPQQDEVLHFLEQYWPYGAAAVLLAVLITAIALSSDSSGPTQPVLRFLPGGM